MQQHNDKVPSAAYSSSKEVLLMLPPGSVLLHSHTLHVYCCCHSWMTFLQVLHPPSYHQ